MSTTGEAAEVDGSDQPATPNSVAVSTSFLPDLEKCSECEAAPAVKFCVSCDVSLCKSCDELVHKPKATRNHVLMKIEEYLVVKRGFSDSSPIDKQLDADEDHMFCFFSPIDYRIDLLPLLAFLVQDPNARPSLVAFVGPTGAGKSTIVRLLMSLDGGLEPGRMPVAGEAGDAQSTSADIRMYAGGLVPAISGLQSSTDPVLYVDCEGLNGSKEPRAIRKLLKTFDKYFPLFKGKIVEYQNRRFEHVQISYPRMLYIFSDVLCHVFQGSLREHESIVTPLLEWGRKASLGAANQHRPQLILIFNKGGKEALAEKFNDFRETYTKWIEGDKNRSRDELQSYFSDPLVCLLPQKDINLERLIARVRLLRKEIHLCSMVIRRSRQEKNQLFNRSQLQLYMQLAADTFSSNSEGEFDIYKASMARRRTSVGLAEYIVEFRLAVEQANSGCTDKYERHRISLNILQSRILSSALLWMRRLDLNLPVGAVKLPNELQTALEDAQKSIDDEMPCGSFHQEYGQRCDTVKQMHTDQHCSLQTSVRWNGTFTPDPSVQRAAEACRLVDLAKSALTSTLDMRAIRRSLSDQRQIERLNHPWLEAFTFYRVCVCCMIELPTEVLSCGHIICAMCAKEEADMSSREMIIGLTCPVCLSPAKWYPKDLPPLAGYRILSLDGGGVRGIVELLTLERIMSFFHGMHVEDLFDFIVGTSTGGIIALALSVRKLNEEPKRLPEVIPLFRDLCKQVFSKEMTRPLAGMSWMLRICQVLRIYDTKYKSDNLLRLLKEHFGEESLLRSCVRGPRVIVTSCDRDNRLSAAWFTSYNRAIKENDVNNLIGQAHRNLKTEKLSRSLLSGLVPDNHLYSAKDAAAATSAAGTYFPAYEAGGRFWIDGGFRFNGPAAIAIQEARTLWPKRSASALISLGCGRLSYDEKHKGSDNLIQLVNQIVDVVTDAETQIQQCFQHVKQLQPDASECCLRLNPTIIVPKDVRCELDDALSVPLLETETNKFLDHEDGKAIVQEAANLLFATLFYLDVQFDQYSLNPMLDSMRIRSRAALPLNLRAALIARGRSSSPPFSVIVYRAVVEPKFMWDTCTWNEGVMDLPFSLGGLPMLHSLKVLVKLHMCLPGTIVTEEWSLPISGMPCSLDATD